MRSGCVLVGGAVLCVGALLGSELALKGYCPVSPGPRR